MMLSEYLFITFVSQSRGNNTTDINLQMPNVIVKVSRIISYTYPFASQEALKSWRAWMNSLALRK